ncbi:MAG: CoA-binding protein [Actinomycetota bacterium]|nr:CoA-binding protein [Thermoleophilia bacterium]MDA3005850.1 CoA-binding protein [Actinomycetota bacterium]
MGPDSTPAEILKETCTIAMIGASPDPSKPSYGVMEYLMAQGYKVIPVRPGDGEILGMPIVNSLQEIGEPIHMVDVFRKSEAAPEVARQAVAVGATSLWLQPGCVSDEAHDIATQAGLAFAEDICTRQVHRDEGVGAIGPSLLP